jgi:hypothetical protein
MVDQLWNRCSFFQNSLPFARPGLHSAKPWFKLLLAL